ncbi:MAG TPA: phosphosulfolactate synthase [Pseudonocardiaceae bacterium]|nr:phosphosulfolactate synthase [Pseudonocardiaceae bacterium]
MWNSPDFLDLSDRAGKPRRRGLTHVLDKGTTITALDALLVQAGHLVDILKIGWGIAYIDPVVKDRVALCRAAGVVVSLGGTLLEVADAQGRLSEFRRWAADIGVNALEVSNGLGALTRQRKTTLIRELSDEFIVLAETGMKNSNMPVMADAWLAEMEADLTAGARWLIAEGRESGTVGLYEPDGSVRAALVDRIAAHLPCERIIFEAPRRTQQSWMVHHLGADVNVGNIPPEEVLPLETLRLGLRADTARLPGHGPTAASQ